ncbi:MAG: M20/M25/M40 family metallo-hydrolase [Bryobacteraceae bacterium]
MHRQDSVRSMATPALRWVMGVSLAGWILIGLWPTRRLQPVPATAPAGEFSAERAMVHVWAIAQRPHPVGSPEHDRVRDYIRAQITTLDLVPAVESGVGIFRSKSNYVENIVARLPGAANTRPVMLASHYDSVSRGPGAADDGHGVAVLLETLRALRNAPPLRNDIIFLFTDGEEIEMLGAALFTKDHPWRKEPGVVLNFEARGTGGPPSMFETSAGNEWLIRDLKAAVPRANATSIAYEVYRRMPNDTDLTVFKRGGLPGLNFAFIGHPEFYHSPEDDPQHLDRSSLQEQGNYALSLTRQFGNEDLNRRHTGNAVYFPTLVTSLIVYPVSWVWPLAWGTVAGLVLVVLVSWRRRSGRLRIALLLALPAAFLLLAAGMVPGVSYILEWPLVGAILSCALLVTAPAKIGFGWRTAALAILPAPVFLLLIPMLQPLVVALGFKAIVPLAAMALLILIFLAPQLVLISGRGAGAD